MSVEPNILILRAPGTNCDHETAFAFERAGGKPVSVHINQLLETPNMVNEFQVLCIPGGFSYGDDIAAGRILSSQLKGDLAKVIGEFHASEKLVIGICNGFQVLIKSGLLLEPDGQGLPATLSWNDSGRFVDQWVHLKADSPKCPFLNGVGDLYLPIAHAEGKFVARNEAVLSALQAGQQLAVKYCNPDGHKGQVAFPHNPNGSQQHVAGLCDSTGRIFGLMPHPERHIDPTHHPQWTRNDLPEKGDGLVIFENAINYFA
ncbi:MAG: phosphoribosylformylglycinamidine synthase I [Mariniblastus sp.]|nr:phosphoribosylformylglycinamidine synthase I [Mariniblastus sp.]